MREVAAAHRSPHRATTVRGIRSRWRWLEEIMQANCSTCQWLPLTDPVQLDRPRTSGRSHSWAC